MVQKPFVGLGLLRVVHLFRAPDKGFLAHHPCPSQNSLSENPGPTPAGTKVCPFFDRFLTIFLHPKKFACGA